MKHAICPNCNADVELPASFSGGDAWCPNCNQGFFVEPPEGQAAPSAIPRPRRAPRPPVVAAQTQASGDVLGESIYIVLKWFIITAATVLCLLIGWAASQMALFLWLAVLAAAIFETALALLAFAYLRTLAVIASKR